MSTQTTLTNNPPMILDATCSYFHIWPRHATIRMDIRPEVKPDVVGDIRNTNFPDKHFDEIYLDPPHMIRTDMMHFPHDKLTIKRRLSGRRSPHMYDRYGVFKSRKEWMDFVEKTNDELLRILKPTGKIIYKATFSKNHRYIKRVDLDKMDNFIVTDEKITNSKKPGSKNKVHYITFQPKQMQAQQ